MVDAERGLGGIIITSQRRGPREHIYLVLVVIMVVAFVTDRLWAPSGGRLSPTGRASRRMGAAARPRRRVCRSVSKTFNSGTGARRAPRSRTSNFVVIEDMPGLRRVRRDPRALGLRQVDDAQPDRRLLRASTRRRSGEVLVRGQHGDRSRPRPRHDLPAVQLVPAPHRARERDLRARARRQDELAARAAPTAWRAARCDWSRKVGLWRRTSASTRTSSRAASSSAWRSRARWCSSPRSS